MLEVVGLAQQKSTHITHIHMQAYNVHKHTFALTNMHKHMHTHTHIHTHVSGSGALALLFMLASSGFCVLRVLRNSWYCRGAGGGGGGEGGQRVCV